MGVHKRVLICAFLIILFPGLLLATELYVNPDIGSDSKDGCSAILTATSGPFKTLNKAVEAIKPGDTVHLLPEGGTYHQVLTINNIHGDPNKPITIDGHGVTLSGAKILDTNDCTLVSPGLWKHINSISSTNAGFISRYFFIIDGKINRMGQCSKGPCEPFLKVEELKEGQWTYIKDDDAYYIKLHPSKLISCVQTPMFTNMVEFRGDSRYIVIKNLNTTHSWNDGFNFYDKIKNIRIENVSAVECGDDGFSTHDRAEVELDGFFATRNATGICNTGTGFSSSRHVLLYNNNGFEYSLFGPGKHVIKDSLIYADAVQPFYLHNNNDPNGQCHLDVQNIAVINTKAELKFVTLTDRTSMTAVNMTLSGIGIKHSGFDLTFSSSTIVGRPVPDIFIEISSVWKSSNNFYSVGNINYNGKVYTTQTFADYQKAANDLTSRLVP